MDGRRGQAVLNRQFYNCCPFPYENIAFRFRPQRKGDFFYRTFQIPLVVLTLLMLLSFAIPFKVWWPPCCLSDAPAVHAELVG